MSAAARTVMRTQSRVAARMTGMATTGTTTTSTARTTTAMPVRRTSRRGS